MISQFYMDWYSMVDYVWYGMVWYGMVWYGMVWYGMVWYGMVWCGMVWFGMVWYDMIFVKRQPSLRFKINYENTCFPFNYPRSVLYIFLLPPDM